MISQLSRLTKYFLVFLLFAFSVSAQENRIPQAPDIEDKELQFFFDGAWMPDLDAAEIGAKNYKQLKNLRYGPENRGLEGVQGYTKINTTPLSTYTKIRSGYQLLTQGGDKSWVLVQAENSGETASRVFVNSQGIPDQQDFSTTVELDTGGNAYRDDSTGAGLGRFSSAPLSSVVYSNGVESLIWSGDKMRLAAFYTMEGADPTVSTAYAIDATDAVNNQLGTTGNTVAVGEAGLRDYFLIMTTRPIQGAYFDISVANTTAAVLDIHYWKNNSAWTALTEADGTLAAGKTLAQDGWVLWPHVTDAAPYHFNGNYYYAYRFYVNDSAADTATATIQHIYVNAPMQGIVDLWDGIPRQPTSFQIWRNSESKYKDFTLEVNEYSYEAAPFVAQLDGLTTSDYMVVMSDDRLSAIKFEFMSGWVNTAAARVIDLKYWDGDSYESATEVDGTIQPATTSMGQNGLVWWQPPAETAEAVKEEFGVTGYSYRIYFTGGSLSGRYNETYTATNKIAFVDSDPDTITDVDSTFLTNGFEAGMSISVSGSASNDGDYTIASVKAGTITLYSTDELTNEGISAIAITIEDKDDPEVEIMEEDGDIALDVVTLIPAQKTIKPFSFMTQYKNRVFGCGYVQGNEGNRCDYTQKYSTEIWNGADSSDDGVQSIYFETSQDLTAAKEIYNRYGSQVITVLAAFTKGETHVLKGDSPEDFSVIRVSDNVGCPAPLTLVTAEIGYDVAQQVKRNIMLWLSSVGPYGFDGQVLFPIKGVDKYFDPTETDCINFDEIERANGWYDQSKKEYNLLIPSGASQATNNVWLVYDLVKKKWFRKDTGVASFPQIGFPVMDVYGTQYIYGGIDSGYMMRLENGNSWDGEPIEQVVETGDFWPTGNIWDLTRIRQIKLMAKRLNDDYSVSVNHASDTDDSLGLSGIWMDEAGHFADWDGGEWVSATLASINIYLSDSLNRIARQTIQDNIFGWAHRFEFRINTDDVTKGFQPLGWGIVFHKEERRDE